MSELQRLEEILSPAALMQVGRIGYAALLSDVIIVSMFCRDIDLCSVDYKYLEREFSDLLREAERVESIILTLLRAVMELKRSEVSARRLDFAGVLAEFMCRSYVTSVSPRLRMKSSKLVRRFGSLPVP